MEQPLVSVIIPFYSRLDWLKEALNSVQSQTYGNIEVLVVNDGSKEDLTSLTENYYLDINIINKENEGPASARNLGIERSKGKYIAFLDSDDLWLPDKLARQIAKMESEKYYWSQHSYEMFWEESSRSKIIDTRNYLGNVLKDSFVSFKVQTSCVVVLRDALIKNNIRFPLDRRYGQDMVFYRKLAKLYPLGYVEGVYTRFRIRGSNAGFRALVQLNDKASTWNDIQNDQKALILLPKSVIFAYRISKVLNNLILFIKKKFIKNENIIEFISKVFYSFPYLIFKLNSKKLNSER